MKQLPAALAVACILLGPGPASSRSAPAPAAEPPANHLAGERSPYLLQHAHNPVDWYPWGEAAFAKARKENKPIFLSVGYSTCHWCHVMERESFENPAIAKLMNDSFVSIKVDREERPDVDATYMAFVQATTGGGGWPMTVFLTPGLKPFVGGTYFPPTDQGGQPGLKTILPELATAWREHRPEIVSQADQITARLREMTTAKAAADPAAAADAPKTSWLDAGFQQLAARFDPANGGFGTDGPKFPQPSTLNFLTRYHARQPADSAGGKRALAMDLLTLRRMAEGGIHDHLGGGFHRYSTDPRWHVPHFEKMLYDQAQLVVAYLEAYQLTGEPLFADTARDILAYVRRDLTDPATGGFLSAEDADSQPAADSPERVEGAFYVWTRAEVEQALPPEDAALLTARYGITDAGNVPPTGDPRGELKGKNVLDATGHSLEAAATAARLTPDAARARLDAARARLLTARGQRPRPRRDDKVITAWNGLMITAFARAAQVLGDPADLAAAQRAAGFLQTGLFDAATGQLHRSYRQGPSAAAGFADDYAFLIQGLLDLYETDFNPDHLRWAEQLQRTQDTLFADPRAGGYFSTAAATNPANDKTPAAASPLLRLKPDDDNAEPSANSVSALNLARLGQMLEDDARGKQSARTLGAFAQILGKAPGAVPQMLVALDFQLGPTVQVVVAGKPDAPDTRAMLAAARRPFLPRRVFLLADGGPDQTYLATRVPFFRDLRPVNGQATAYVCRNFACQLPTNDLTEMGKLLAARFPPTAVP